MPDDLLGMHKKMLETKTSMISIYLTSLSLVMLTIIIIQPKRFLWVPYSQSGLSFLTGQIIDDGMMDPVYPYTGIRKTKDSSCSEPHNFSLIPDMPHWLYGNIYYNFSADALES